MNDLTHDELTAILNKSGFPGARISSCSAHQPDLAEHFGVPAGWFYWVTVEGQPSRISETTKRLYPHMPNGYNNIMVVMAAGDHGCIKYTAQ